MVRKNVYILKQLQVSILTVSILMLLCGCYSNDPKNANEVKEEAINNTTDLIAFFNKKGKYPRFKNSDLIFGDSVNTWVKELLQFDESGKIKASDKIFRKSAYVFEDKTDTLIYFMYGYSRQDSILDELRMRSFKNDSLIDDFLIIDFLKYPNVSYNYQINEDVLIVVSTKGLDKTHHSFIQLIDGRMSDCTIVPDTIFRRQDYMPIIGQKVRIYDNFKTKKLVLDEKEYPLTGTIVKGYGGGKSCTAYMMIQIKKAPNLKYEYLQTEQNINNQVSLYGLRNDSLELREQYCFDPSYWPVDEPVLIKSPVYIEYFADVTQ